MISLIEDEESFSKSSLSFTNALKLLEQESQRKVKKRKF
jgi:hypothetical protein